MHVYDVKAIIYSVSAYSGLARQTIKLNPIWSLTIDCTFPC